MSGDANVYAYGHGVLHGAIRRVGVEHSRRSAELFLHQRLRIVGTPVVASTHEVGDPHAVHVGYGRPVREGELARERDAHGGLVPHEGRRRRGQCAEEGQVAGEARQHGARNR